MYFVKDQADAPPYTPLPRTAFNVTNGVTYYTTDENGVHSMKEVYSEYCIPVFGDPNAPMGRGNHYSCDFLNVGSTNTSFVVLHNDRPVGAPECCIIGKPFHPPPQDFHENMPVKWNERIGKVSVDWGAVYDKDAGIFNYGFEAPESAAADAVITAPFAFYMTGVPWVANWMWQAFSKWQPVDPPASIWTIPSTCDLAEPCPGW